MSCKINYCDVLQSVLKVLETPNSLDAFRRAGGFTGLLSLVVDMEGALSDPPQREVWKLLGYQQLLDLLLLCLHILNLAVHLHTVNAHHFETGGFYEKLGEALLQLGCFHTEDPHKDTFTEEWGAYFKTSEDNHAPLKSFHQFVELSETPGASSSSSCCTSQLKLPPNLQTCIRLLSYLVQFATGSYSPLELLEVESACNEGLYSRSSSVHLRAGPQSVEDINRKCRDTSPSISTENQDRWILVGNKNTKLFSFLISLFSQHVVLNIYFLCAFSLVGLPLIMLFFIQGLSGWLWLFFHQCFLQRTHRYTGGNAPSMLYTVYCLIRSISFFFSPQLSVEVQFSLVHHIQAVVKTEQNRQVLCNGGLISTLLNHCRSILLEPDHMLHLPVTRILEKLTSQAISHTDLR